MPTISVVAPTFKRSQSLSRLLQALARQTLPRGEFEIVIVDDTGGADPTTHVATQAAQQLGVSLRLICLPENKGPAAARNTGWRAAKAALIAFTDDDTEPDPDWLAIAVNRMNAHPGWGAATGVVRVPRPVMAQTLPTDHELMTRGLETAAFVTANAFFRRQTLELLGGFDERFKRPWREDSEIEFRLQDAGIPIGRITGAVVRHPVRPEKWGVCLRQQKNVFFDVLLFSKHPRRYLSQLHYRPPLLYYGIVTAAAACLLTVVKAPAASACAATACVAQILLLAYRRIRPTSRSPSHMLEMLVTSALIPFLAIYWRVRGILHFRKLFI